MKKAILLAVLGLVGFGFVPAGADSKYTTSPLSVYSGGFGIGSDYSLTQVLRDDSEQHLHLSQRNRIYLNPWVSGTGDIHWYLPGNHWGLDLGFDVKMLPAGISPIMGASVGFHQMAKRGEPLGRGLGASLQARGGLAVQLTETFEVQVTVPWTVIGNHARDQMVGLHIGFLFSDGLRHVGKLNYW